MDSRLANPERVREKWAGADLNCGYGHPKAEGYQATPPARVRIDAAANFKGCDRTRSVTRKPRRVEPVVRDDDRVVGV